MVTSGRDRSTDLLGADLVVERHGPVGWLIFNRPGSGNAMNAAMLDGLEEAWLELDADPAVRVIVNTGEGRAFQTGLDVVELSKNPDALREQSPGPSGPNCGSRPGTIGSGSRSSPPSTGCVPEGAFISSPTQTS